MLGVPELLKSAQYVIVGDAPQRGLSAGVDVEADITRVIPTVAFQEVVLKAASLSSAPRRLPTSSAVVPGLDSKVMTLVSEFSR
jgi:hypothetical protein